MTLGEIEHSFNLSYNISKAVSLLSAGLALILFTYRIACQATWLVKLALQQLYGLRFWLFGWKLTSMLFSFQDINQKYPAASLVATVKYMFECGCADHCGRATSIFNHFVINITINIICKVFVFSLCCRII